MNVLLAVVFQIVPGDAPLSIGVCNLSVEIRTESPRESAANVMA